MLDPHAERLAHSFAAAIDKRFRDHEEHFWATVTQIGPSLYVLRDGDTQPQAAGWGNTYEQQTVGDRVLCILLRGEPIVIMSVVSAPTP